MAELFEFGNAKPERPLRMRKDRKGFEYKGTPGSLAINTFASSAPLLFSAVLDLQTRVLTKYLPSRKNQRWT